MMDLKQLITDDDAVSPVIGVILMVAITVILAAVIGAFVLNIGGNQEAAPQAQFEFSYSSGPSLDDISHGGGGPVDMSEIGASLDDKDGGGATISLGATGTLSAGESLTPSVTGSLASGDEIDIVWTSSSGENTQIIAESTVP